MPTPHPHPYHAGSLFGDGPRRPLDREQRARFRFLLTAHRRARRLTPHAELIGNALVKRLSTDGQCDPGHDTIAADVGCCARTVRRALDALKALGLVIWQRRIVREGWAVRQVSNAYLLVPIKAQVAPIFRAVRTGGQTGRQTLQLDISSVQQAVPEVSERERREAREVMAQRQAVIQARLLNRGSGSAVRAL
jgi:hypothetical protein